MLSTKYNLQCFVSYNVAMTNKNIVSCVQCFDSKNELEGEGFYIYLIKRVYTSLNVLRCSVNCSHLAFELTP